MQLASSRKKLAATITSPIKRSVTAASS